MVHADPGVPTIIGNDCVISHHKRAIVHGSVLEDGVLIGMGAILLNGVHVERGCIIGAGALLTEGTRIPAGSLVLGTLRDGSCESWTRRARRRSWRTRRVTLHCRAGSTYSLVSSAREQEANGLLRTASNP